MSSHVPPEVADAVYDLDQESLAWSEKAKEAWRKVRTFVRTRHKESQRALPAISRVAQEVVLVRDHAQAALDEMSSVFGHHGHVDDPDTTKHEKPPEEK